jgi:hypothetical protein
MLVNYVFESGLAVPSKKSLLTIAFKKQGFAGLMAAARSELFAKAARVPVHTKIDKRVAALVGERWLASSDEARQMWRYPHRNRLGCLVLKDEAWAGNNPDSKADILVVLDRFLDYREDGELAGFSALARNLNEGRALFQMDSALELLEGEVTRAELLRVTKMLSKKQTSSHILSDGYVAKPYKAIKSIVSDDPTSALAWTILLYDITTTYGDNSTIHQKNALEALRALRAAGFDPELFYALKRRGYNRIESMVALGEAGIDLDLVDAMGKPGVEETHASLYDVLANANITSRFANTDSEDDS